VSPPSGWGAFNAALATLNAGCLGVAISRGDLGWAVWDAAALVGFALMAWREW
jgi:hypothetical protein